MIHLSELGVWPKRRLPGGLSELGLHKTPKLLVDLASTKDGIKQNKTNKLCQIFNLCGHLLKYLNLNMVKPQSIATHGDRTRKEIIESLEWVAYEWSNLCLSCFIVLISAYLPEFFYIECGILGMLMFFFASSVNSLNPHGTCRAFKGNIFYSTCNRCNIPFAGANRWF